MVMVVALPAKRRQGGLALEDLPLLPMSALNTAETATISAVVWAKPVLALIPPVPVMT
jgi:hypothetical protein